MDPILSYVNQFPERKDETLQLLQSWVNINSHSENLVGLEEMIHALKTTFSSLEGEIKEITLPPYKKIDSKGLIGEIPVGKALSITKHPQAPFKVFFGGHMDTVYPTTDPFQKGVLLDQQYKGPGAADMKGGLLVLFKALEALEQSPYAGKIGWEVLINPDEEIGSPSSEFLLKQAAKRNQLALIFEPSFPDGSIVHERKGSINFTIISRGKAAHAGRDFYSGRNAISALARFILGVETLTNRYKGITVNVGHVEGGGAANIVPDLAICKVNIRITHPKDFSITKESLEEMVKGSVSPDGIAMEIYQHSERPPKPFDEKQQRVFEQLKACAAKFNIDLKWQSTGGVCDGNILAAAGLPTIDSLGVVGGNLHTADEYLLVDSLWERARLVAFYLMKLANQEITLS